MNLTHRVEEVFHDGREHGVADVGLARILQILSILLGAEVEQVRYVGQH